IAAARPRLDVGQAVPLVGKWTEGLLEDGELSGPHGQLPLLGGHHQSFGPDPVPQVERLGAGEGVVSDLALVDEDLDRAAHVLEGEEEELPEGPAEHDPAGHRDVVVGDRPRIEIFVLGVEFGGDMGALVTSGQSLGEERLVLLEAPRHQRIDVGFVGHDAVSAASPAASTSAAIAFSLRVMSSTTAAPAAARSTGAQTSPAGRARLVPSVPSGQGHRTRSDPTMRPTMAAITTSWKRSSKRFRSVEKEARPITHPRAKTSTARTRRSFTAPRTGAYMPIIRSMNDPETPGRIIAQMATAPDPKKAHNGGSTTVPPRKPRNQNVTIAAATSTPTVTASRRSTIRQATNIDPATKPKNRPAMWSG